MGFAVTSDFIQNTNRNNINGQHHHQHVTSTAVAAVASLNNIKSSNSNNVMSHQHSTPIPPIAHAIGGSIGSTLSTLLLYPLERSRIEMQTQTSDDTKHCVDRKRNGIEIVQDYLSEEEKFPSSNIGHGSNDHTNDESVLLQDKVGTSDSDSTGYFSYNVIDSGDKSLSSCREELSSSSSSSPSPCSTSSLPSCPTLKKNDAIHPWVLLRNLLFQKSPLIRTIYQLHLQGRLYKGCTPIAVTIAFSNFIFFYTLQSVKKLMKQNSISLLTSSIAGIVNVLLTNPLWVANLRLVQEPPSLPLCDDDNDNIQNVNEDASTSTSISSSKQQSRYKGMIHCLKEIYRTEGIRQLWAGTGASLLLVSNPAIQYYIYENCKIRLLERDAHRLIPTSSRNSLRPLEAFLVGALAKGFATIATYPLQLAQVLLRLQSSDGDDEMDEHDHEGNRSKAMTMTRNHHKTRYSNLLDCLFTIYKGGGVTALYSGIHAKLLHTVLSSALTFLSYEQILNLVAKSYWWALSKRLVKNDRTIT